MNVLNGSARRDFLQTDTGGSSGVLDLCQHIVDYTCKYSETEFGTIIDVKATVQDARFRVRLREFRIQNPECRRKKIADLGSEN